MRSNFWRVALLVSLVSALLMAGALLAALNHLDPMPMHVIVNGVEWQDSLHLETLMPAHQLALVLGLAALLLVGVLLLPVLLLVLALCVALPLCLALGIPLLVAGLLAALFLGPPVLIVWGLWRLLRTRPAAPTPATIQP